MSSVLLKNQLSNARLQVLIAFGADLTADPATWAYADVTADVLQANSSGISIRLGKPDESTVAPPANCTFRLKNQTGNYTPTNPAAPNYPNVRLGTPVQVRVSLNGGSTWSIRFQGEASSWLPGWDVDGKFAYVTLTAAGITRRLGMGNTPILNVLTRYHVRNGAAAVWAFDDGKDATQAANAVPNGAPMQQLASVTYGLDSSVSGNPALGGAGTVTGLPSPAPSGDTFTAAAVNIPMSGELHIDFWRNMAPEPDASETRLLMLDLTGGGAGFATIEIRARMSQTSPAVVPGWKVIFAGGGTLDTAAGTGSPGSSVDPFDGTVGGFWHNVHLKLVQSGSDVVTSIYIDGSLADSHTFTSITLPTMVTNVHVRNDVPVGGGIGNADRLGPHAINTTAGTVPSYTVSTTLNAGETADERITRLCDEEGVSLTLVGTSNMIMGTQSASTFMNLLRECEKTDMGVLFDGLGAGLYYVARSSLYAQSAQVTVDANAGQVPTPGPQPAFDDQGLINKVTVTNTNGSSVVRQDAVSVPAIGPHETQVQVNLNTDDQLDGLARWFIHVRTPTGMRYPQVTIDFTAAPELATSWVAAVPTDRFDVTNLSNRLTQHPVGTVSLFVEGWSEFLSGTRWSAAVNNSDYSPWITDSLGGQFRLEMAGQTLVSDLASGATSLSLATASGHALFTTNLADFPMDLNIAGWQVHVTAASGSSSPQTLTINASPNTSTILAGTTVSLWQPAALAL